MNYTVVIGFANDNYLMVNFEVKCWVSLAKFVLTLPRPCVVGKCMLCVVVACSVA